MDDEVITMDGHAFMAPEEGKRRLDLVVGEGVPLLAAFGAIADPKVRASLLDLVRQLAKADEADV